MISRYLQVTSMTYTKIHQIYKKIAMRIITVNQSKTSKQKQLCYGQKHQKGRMSGQEHLSTKRRVSQFERAIKVPFPIQIWIQTTHKKEEINEKKEAYMLIWAQKKNFFSVLEEFHGGALQDSLSTQRLLTHTLNKQPKHKRMVEDTYRRTKSKTRMNTITVNPYTRPWKLKEHIWKVIYSIKEVGTTRVILGLEKEAYQAWALIFCNGQNILFILIMQ